MARVKRGVIAGRRHKKVLAKAKGYYNARRKVYRTAKQAVIKAGQSQKRHILTKKTSKRKRNLRGTTMVAKQDAGRLDKLLPHA